jgi:hypothetical protein
MKAAEIPADEAEADRVWTAAVLACVPEVAASPGLAARLLAGFEARAARRGWFAAWGDAIWPGAPAWAPVSAFALALVVGIGAGAALPSRAVADADGAFSLAAPPSFNLASDDLASLDDAR